MNKGCSECPWNNNNPHSLKFRNYVDKMESIGKIKNHKCHMKSSDVWAKESDINDDNICIGSLKRKNRESNK
jgi:hypothetical protein